MMNYFNTVDRVFQDKDNSIPLFLVIDPNVNIHPDDRYSISCIIEKYNSAIELLLQSYRDNTLQNEVRKRFTFVRMLIPTLVNDGLHDLIVHAIQVSLKNMCVL